MAIDQQLAAESARKQANSLEKAEAAANKGGSGGGATAWENPFIQKKGEGMFDYALRINKAKMEGRIVERNVTTSSVDESGFDFGLGRGVKPAELISKMPMDKTTQEQLKSKPSDIAALAKNAQAPITNPQGNTNIASLIIDGFKNVVTGIEQRMDSLSASITALANTPRSLTVQSCSPMDDAASILSDIANNSAIAAGRVW